MRVRFEYADHTVWEGLPEDAELSPDPKPLRSGWTYEANDEGAGGVIRMVAICDHDTEIAFSYQDFYYLYPLAGGSWGFGSASPTRVFVLNPDQRGADATELPFEIPADAVVRTGVTVSQEEAVECPA